MSLTAYAVSRYQGANSYSGYLYTSINGPLSTSKYPNILHKTNLGVLPTINQSPPQFYPYQSPPFAQQFSNLRQEYRRTAIGNNTRALQTFSAKKNNPYLYWSTSTSNAYPNTAHSNYINPIPSSLYSKVKSSVAVGKSSYGIGLPTNTPTSSKNYDPSFVNTRLRYVRNAGCVAPKKKGAIANYNLRNPNINGWGSIVRSTY